MLKASDIMTRDVRSVGPDSNLGELARLFEETNYNTLPVLDGESRLLGVVTQTDLVERDKPLHIPTVISIFDWVLYVESEKKFHEDVKRMTATAVADIMSPARATCTEDTPVAEIAALMSDNKAHLVPVLKDEKVVGVVARLDIIRAMGA